jgi:hypothetical protein
MCCHRLISKFLASILLLGVCGGLQAADQCGPYHEDRVSFLLGCCGDISVYPPGPPFPDKLDDRERATLAIREARESLEICGDKGSPEYLSMILDMAGAYLLRSDAVTEAGNTGTRAERLRRAAADARSALAILLAFEKEHPRESFRVWKWMATALSRTGSPWDALQFLVGLPVGDAEKGERSRYEGDVLFRIGLRGAAADAYVEWLSSAHVNPCAQDSFAMAAVLETSGFRFLRYQRPTNVLCDAAADRFSYYISLGPADISVK